MSFFSIIARDARGYTSPVVVVTIVECPNCVHGECNFDTAQRHEDATSAYYQRASCACNTGYTGTPCSGFSLISVFTKVQSRWLPF